MSIAAERIVVQATASDKRAIAEKAQRLHMPVSELMRRGAFAYQATDEAASDNAGVAALADAARLAAERSALAIDGALAFIEASEQRLQAQAQAQAQARKAGGRR